jgi:cyclophilin family peptidyl-prolyl cis-trans isomerase
MVKKKRAVKPTPAERTERFIRYTAGALIALVVGAFAWQYLPEEQAPICKKFDSIPAAAQYAAPPPQQVDVSARYLAAVEMEDGGRFVIELYPEKAPVTVNSFIFLACKGFYDGATFHRVLDGFMAQTGDPTGTGSGGPGYQFQNEDSDLTFDKAGVVAMANSGRDTNGSQFFITFGPAPHLNGGYTIFGQIIEGMDVVNGITRRDPAANPNFPGDAIKTITITEE